MLSRIVPHALALTLFLACPAGAAEAPYKSVAALESAGQSGVEAALQDALGRLLIRITGRLGAAGLVDRFPSASSIVRQYRVVEGNRLEAEFDAALVRRLLEQADELIWEGARPDLAVWLVINDGGRWLFRPLESGEAARNLDARQIFSGALNRALAEASALRGIELRYSPPPDASAALACAEELWTGFFGCLGHGREQLLMLGRVAIPSAPEDIEWSLRENGQWTRVWESGAADAVHSVTDMLAARFMATQGPLRAYVLTVSPVPDFAAYLRLKAGLENLGAVRGWRLESALRDSLRLRITSRTAEALLLDALGALGLEFELARAES